MTRWPIPILLAVLCACSDDDAQQRACDALDDAWRLESLPQSESCEAPPAPRDLSSADKLAVAVYHFNIQYVAGGLAGYLGASDRWDEAAIEDLIVVESFEPLLDIYLEHPSFRVDIELQAYMLEIIALRHPGVWQKMQQLGQSGQVDFDSFHYSDQLYVAYPHRDMEVSLDLTRDLFAQSCVPVGRSIFTQEGQFTVGQLPLASERGYAVSILPKNLYTFQLGEPNGVLFEDPNVPGHPVIIGGRSYNGTDGGGNPFELRWTFMNDGEIALTENSAPPYFADVFRVDPARVAAHIAELEDLESQGYTLATVAEAVAAMQARGINPQPLPPVLDGTWQPRDTNNVFRWMGGRGLFHDEENDAKTLAAIWEAHRRLRWLEQRDLPDKRAINRGMTAAWRELLLAEVSDSTGWNPFLGEVKYSLTHAENVHDLIDDILTCAGKKKEGAPASFGCDKGDAVNLADLGVEIYAPERTPTVEAVHCDNVPGLIQVTVDTEAIDTIETHADGSTFEQELNERELEVRLQITEPFRIVQALESTPRSIDLDNYVFEIFAIPLPVGLLGLDTDAGRWLIQDQSNDRLALVLSRLDGERGTVKLINESVMRAQSTSRRFFVTTGIDEATALELTEQINGPL